MNETFLVVGLGNPGNEYKMTPHNAGFMSVEKLAKKHHCRFRNCKFQGVLAKYEREGSKVFILKPHTYMNNSGVSVAALMKYYRIPVSRLVVIYDDKDIELGKLRIRDKGHSLPSHNGLKSVIEALGTNQFARVRFGIGAPPKEQVRLMDYVTSKIPFPELETYDATAEEAADAADMIIFEGMEAAQQRFSSKS